jgi:hypothetical protein
VMLLRLLLAVVVDMSASILFAERMVSGKMRSLLRTLLMMR